MRGNEVPDELADLGVQCFDAEVIENSLKEHIKLETEKGKLLQRLEAIAHDIEIVKTTIRQQTKTKVSSDSGKRLIALLSEKESINLQIEEISKSLEKSLKSDESLDLHAIEKENMDRSICDDSDESNEFLQDDADLNQFEHRLETFEQYLFLPQRDSRHRVYQSFDGSDVSISGLKIPNNLWNTLFEHQKTGLRWLWELHQQNVGGILGDEMGLGKTIQVIALLGSLHRTFGLSKGSGRVLIACPASVLHNWLKEFRTWYPWLRVVLLHDAGNHDASHEDILDELKKTEFVVITTYATLRSYRRLLQFRWNYVILDEGHQIKNPNAAITFTCKQLLSLHRLVLSGSPIQNNLKELWSLVDFVFPGKLGTLPVFEEEFCVPIRASGYIHASELQIENAFRCATMLKKLISPHILRRLKKDVNIKISKKTERVLFCNLTPFQVKRYYQVLGSKEVSDLLDNHERRNLAFKEISVLRKLCNHPILLELDQSIEPWNLTRHSGKLRVLATILRMWYQQGHRVLLFSQTKIMLDLIQAFVEYEDYRYRRMDGSTSIKSRGGLMDEFNGSSSIFLFLLTSRTGGLGVNLTGADRVILFDPDWNPSTDDQAQDRAYRIGQLKDVVIYRLICRGSIEEKIYHRQIFKKFLSNKVLQDPAQKRFFKQNQMRDLFELTGYAKDSNYVETNLLVSNLDAEIDDQLDGSSKMDEHELLEALFDGDDLESVLKHDKVVQPSQEKILIHKQAQQQAERALKKLKRSRDEILQHSVSEPTWTGQKGVAGAPRFGGVSRMVFGEVKKTVGSSKLFETVRDQSAGFLDDREKDKYESLVEGLTDFIARFPNGVSSLSVSQRFALHLVTKRDRIVFKKILRLIADLEVLDERKAVWILKQEFQ